MRFSTTKKYAFTSSLCLAISLFFCSQIGHAALPNLELVNKKVIDYYQEGQYLKDIRKKIEPLKQYLRERIAKNMHRPQPEKLAIVLDIDETSLSNMEAIISSPLANKFQPLEKSILQKQGIAIKPTLQLYQLALQNNIAVFFVTGRRERLREVTTKNLQDAGYKGWSGLVMKPNDYNQASVIDYKSTAREQLQHDGFKIIANIGDQASDLAGPEAEKNIKLPNPYYYIP